MHAEGSSVTPDNVPSYCSDFCRVRSWQSVSFFKQTLSCFPSPFFRRCCFSLCTSHIQLSSFFFPFYKSYYPCPLFLFLSKPHLEIQCAHPAPEELRPGEVSFLHCHYLLLAALIRIKHNQHCSLVSQFENPSGNEHQVLGSVQAQMRAIRAPAFLWLTRSFFIHLKDALVCAHIPL